MHGSCHPLCWRICKQVMGWRGLHRYVVEDVEGQPKLSDRIQKFARDIGQKK